MIDGQHQDKLSELSRAYWKAMEFVDLLEQIMPGSRTSPSILQHLADGLHHRELLIKECLRDTNVRNEEVIQSQMEAVYKSYLQLGFVAIDAAVPFGKEQINKTLSGVSLDAIKELYKEYWDHATEFDKIEGELNIKRNQERPTTNLADLESYGSSFKRLVELTRINIEKQRILKRFQRRANRTLVFRQMVYLLLALLAGFISRGCILK